MHSLGAYLTIIQHCYIILKYNFETIICGYLNIHSHKLLSFLLFDS